MSAHRIKAAASGRWPRRKTWSCRPLLAISQAISPRYRPSDPIFTPPASHITKSRPRSLRTPAASTATP